ncbi:hypothetical protein Dtox_1268 [Desulfofarcimen acetoxidans DSM 771]|jgi:hypothetical protein|uniref:Uncharacterized protein n=1 Tax=Desulfofarcimen acetoxidans (strain ATCC 49208 / DSM 771 / KCTC 5769 / VKM B-1644 / 5575) TaxID=485916 RepID=C8W5G8_DESAS|nr:hypothetical protein [Desulfofarcimen acetoxidans]ACV62150.1 hypothetical protein Dtox_1268 [Desulfofarcimen acetoxidans DSM 771]
MAKRVQGFLREEQETRNPSTAGYRPVWKTGRAPDNKKRQLLNGPNRPSV